MEKILSESQTELEGGLLEHITHKLKTAYLGFWKEEMTVTLGVRICF